MNTLILLALVACHPWLAGDVPRTYEDLAQLVAGERGVELVDPMDLADINSGEGIPGIPPVRGRGEGERVAETAAMPRYLVVVRQPCREYWVLREDGGCTRETYCPAPTCSLAETLEDAVAWGRLWANGDGVVVTYHDLESCPELPPWELPP